MLAALQYRALVPTGVPSNSSAVATRTATIISSTEGTSASATTSWILGRLAFPASDPRCDGRFMAKSSRAVAQLIGKGVGARRRAQRRRQRRRTRAPRSGSSAVAQRSRGRRSRAAGCDLRGGAGQPAGERAGRSMGGGHLAELGPGARAQPRRGRHGRRVVDRGDCASSDASVASVSPLARRARPGARAGGRNATASRSSCGRAARGRRAASSRRALRRARRRQEPRGDHEPCASEAVRIPSATGRWRRGERAGGLPGELGTSARGRGAAARIASAAARPRDPHAEAKTSRPARPANSGLTARSPDPLSRRIAANPASWRPAASREERERSGVGEDAARDEAGLEQLGEHRRARRHRRDQQAR